MINKHKIIIIGIIVVIVAGFYFQADIRKEIAAGFFKQGSYYFSQENYNLDKAENWYQKALAIYPRLPNTHYQLARIYFVKNDFEKALAEINIELTINYSNQRSYYIRGLVNGYRKDYDAAVNDFQKFIVSSPNEWAGYNDLAWVYYEKEDYEKSKETLLEGLKFSPENAWLLNGLSVIYLKTENFSLAEEILKKSQEASEKLTLEDYKRAYPGNDPKLLSGNFDNFKNNIGNDFIPACSSSNYNQCSGTACVSISCDPDHESCSDECSNDINCGAAVDLKINGSDGPINLLVNNPDTLANLTWSLSFIPSSCLASTLVNGNPNNLFSGDKPTSGSENYVLERGDENPGQGRQYGFSLACQTITGNPPTVSDIVNVGVFKFPIIDRFNCNPSAITPPQAANCNIGVRNADYGCVISGGSFSETVCSNESDCFNDSIELRPSQNTAFTLTCFAIDGNRSASQIITVSGGGGGVGGGGGSSIWRFFRNIIWREVIPR